MFGAAFGRLVRFRRPRFGPFGPVAARKRLDKKKDGQPESAAFPLTPTPPSGTISAITLEPVFMQMTILSAQPRTVTGRKTDALRAEGQVPAVAYGSVLKAPKNLSVERMAFSRALKEAGESSIVELQVEGEQALHVLIQNIQVDPIRGQVTHVDFRAVDMNKPVEADVKLVPVGASLALKAGGTLVHVLDTLEVRALPKDLPHELTVDIARLATFDDVIHVKDIAVPSGVQVLDDAEATVLLVEAPRTEEELAALDQAVEMDVTKVEKVEKKKAEEPEEGGTAEAPAPMAKK